MKPFESRIGVNEKALQKSLPDMYRQFVGGESRFLYACLSRKFDPSIVIVAESSFTIMAVYKALKRSLTFEVMPRRHQKVLTFLLDLGLELLVLWRLGQSVVMAM